jgi:hypothetical protein
MKDVRERLAAQGIDPLGTTPEELATIMKADGEKWGSSSARPGSRRTRR